MELSRSQYKQLLVALDNNIEKADSIADLFESWTPAQSLATTVACAPLYKPQNEIVRTFD